MLSLDQCKTLKANYFGKQIDLLRKQVFLYEYVSFVNRLNENKLKNVAIKM